VAGHFKKNQFKSKSDGQSKAKRSHACLDCRYNQPAIWKVCPYCGGKNRQYFMSHAELKRGMLLLTLQDAGTISNLRFQPKYDLTVNGQKIAAYVADAEYRMDGVIVYEDTKPKDFIDKAALLKIKLFEAIYGVEVRIPQRESGNRHTGKPELPLITKKDSNYEQSI
jgi:hypothetical protein